MHSRIWLSALSVTLPDAAPMHAMSRGITNWNARKSCTGAKLRPVCMNIDLVPRPLTSQHHLKALVSVTFCPVVITELN